MMRCRAIMLAMLACGATPAIVPPTLGTVSSATIVTCPAGASPSANCTSVTVSCPSLSDLTATIAVSDPTSPARGTIFLHDNVGGTTFFDYGFVGAYLAQGFRVVQVQWQSDWESSDVGIKASACRYATMLSYAFTHAHGADRTTGFCAQSFGGGSGGLAMSLAHFGAGDFLDAATLTAGPPFARLDLGCDPTTPPRAACPEIASVPVAYSGGVLGLMSQWENAPSCGTSGASASETARWARDSILSTGATLDYPQTSLAAWYCTNAPDVTVGQGSIFFRRGDQRCDRALRRERHGRRNVQRRSSVAERAPGCHDRSRHALRAAALNFDAADAHALGCNARLRST